MIPIDHGLEGLFSVPLGCCCVGWTGVGRKYGQNSVGFACPTLPALESEKKKTKEEGEVGEMSVGWQTRWRRTREGCAKSRCADLADSRQRG